MNKNSIIGFSLIAVILIAFSWYNSKVFTEQQKEQFKNDSIAAVKIAEQKKLMPADSTDTSAMKVLDSNAVAASSIYKDTLLDKASKGSKEITTLENNKIKVDLSNIGAQPEMVQIKGYYSYDSLDLNLVKQNQSKFELKFFTNQEIATSNFAFTRQSVDDSSVTYRLYVDSVSFVEYKYTLPKDSYMLNLNIRFSGMDKQIQKNVTNIDLNWMMDVPRFEKGYDNEKNYSTVVYKFPNSKGVEDLGMRKEESSEDIKTKLYWFAFQQQFFSAILVSDNSFTNGKLSYTQYPETDPSKNLMRCEANMQIPFVASEDVSVPLQFYFGPNHYKTLKSYDKGFEKIVPLGGFLIGWINRFFIIPTFDILNNFIGNYGLIILILTLIIKLIISPLTIKSYMSSAKMRVLKPEVDKINAKYPKSEDAMKKQQEVMGLYRKTGVSMFGGCLPILLQFPILFAMFKFFPASFELRQQGFLWADDLSAYDSILNLPFSIPLYGDHVSLFALLMAVSMYFYSRMNIDQLSAGPQMAGMKFMSLYFMPLFLLVLCNNFSSGLSYYYMLSNVITMIQTWVIRKYFVDEDKIYAKLKEKAAGPAKKSKFQERLDAAYKAQQQKAKPKK
ncbi:MAG: membrane protein insertase YidC [Bacteroidales bacterium]